MTESITSKYNMLYWVKDIAVPLMPIILLCFFGYRAITMSGSTLGVTDELEIAGILLIFPLSYGIRLYVSPPKKITVAPDGIEIYQFIARKKILIKYNEIDKTRTLRPSNNDGIFAGLNSSQRLELELVDGKIFSFNEDEYENYDALKAAIYDHMYRGL